jgi:hypothetical protein
MGDEIRKGRATNGSAFFEHFNQKSLYQAHIHHKTIIDGVRDFQLSLRSVIRTLNDNLHLANNSVDINNNDVKLFA